MPQKQKRIILHNPEKNLYEIWGALTDICKAHHFPFNALKRRKFPFEYMGCKFIKRIKGEVDCSDIARDNGHHASKICIDEASHIDESVMKTIINKRK